MREQFVWVLISLAGFGLVWLPRFRLGSLSTAIRATGILVFSLPWFWLPFTDQPRLTGALSTVMTAGGIGFFAYGMILMGYASKRIHPVIGYSQVNPIRLVTDGAYGIVRHPIYGGLVTAYLGWALSWSGVYALLLTPILFLALRLEAQIEETYILKPKFDQAFMEYRRTKPAFFPGSLLVLFLVLAIMLAFAMFLGWIPLT